MVKNIYILLLFVGLGSYAQKTTVTGKVTEVETGTPIPFATVVFIGTYEGAITDFDGNFTATTTQKVDSMYVTYVGYVKRVKPLKQGHNQSINFQLEEDITTLNEVVVTPGENPAFKILRNVMDNKKKFDKRELEAYEYESYVRTEFDLDNISDEFRERKMMRKVLAVLDSADQVAGEDGKPILPLMMSEALSRFYYRKSPFAKHEDIIRTKVSGVGITDGTLTSQLIGSTYQEYNFYQNWLNIVGKEFASPIANGWKLIYEYDLVDSLYIGDDYCYKLEFFPKQELDLAFKGTMWITKDEYALKQIDAYVPNASNLNFVEKIKIQQELAPTEAGPWLPAKTRVVVDFKPVTKKTAGILAKFYISNKDFVVNQPKENAFYMNVVSLDPNVRKQDESFWKDARHDSLTATELHVFNMIDTLKNIPAVRNVTEMVKFGATGYIKTGPVHIGPYTTFFGNNNIEGVRLGVGLRTNADFSNKWTIGGYTGYGFDDQRWKYNVAVSLLANRDPWTEITYQQQYEVEQIWLLHENIDANSLFYTFSRFGNLIQPFLKNKYRLSFQRQLGQGLNTELAVKHESVKPLFDFRYFKNGNEGGTFSSYSISEASITTRYGKDEIIVVNDNQRINLGPIRFPVYEVSYSYGSEVAWGDFNYHKLEVSIRKQQKMGIFGVSNFQLGGGYLFGNVPYSLLFNPIGNETPFFVGFAYNQMDYFEFSSDRYVEFKYRHAFEGFIFNRIPLFRKLKWRMIASSNILFGDIQDKNIRISDFPTDLNGNPELPFRLWTNTPYIEVGYGIENILRVFSVQAFHRLTYVDDNANKFGLKFNISLGL